MYKLGQLSIETLIIYGIIVFAALSVVGSLIYFNILDIGSYLPDSCSMGGTGDLKCEEMRFSSDAESAAPNPVLELGIRNIGQRSISSFQVSIRDDGGIHFNSVGPGTARYKGVSISNTNALPPGAIASVSLNPATTVQGKTLRGTVTTQYMFKDGAITQEAVGSIRVKAS